jgi:hypothetical protein
VQPENGIGSSRPSSPSYTPSPSPPPQQQLPPPQLPKTQLAQELQHKPQREEQEGRLSWEPQDAPGQPKQLPGQQQQQPLAAAAAPAAGGWHLNDMALRQGAGSETGHMINSEVWLIQEYCNRGPLLTAVERGAFLSQPAGQQGGAAAGGGGASPNLISVLQTLQEIAAALQYLHQHNVVHGDLTGGWVAGRVADWLGGWLAGWVASQVSPWRVGKPGNDLPWGVRGEEGAAVVLAG